jgi:sporulation protein YlmC with PRC-barrel domain
MSAYPLLMIESVAKEEARQHDEPPGDPHLRSAEEVTGYHICGSDGEIGHVADFIVDDETWAIRYLVVDTSNWWFGKKVLVAPGWAYSISFAKSLVYVNLTKEQIKNSPAWNPEALVNREYEERLYDYYGRPAYWTSDQAATLEQEKDKTKNQAQAASSHPPQLHG